MLFAFKIFFYCLDHCYHFTMKIANILQHMICFVFSKKRVFMVCQNWANKKTPRFSIRYDPYGLR